MACSNRNKIKNNCGTLIFADCARYEGDVSQNSSLVSGCLTLEETTQDIYDQLDIIDSKLDMSSMNNDCIVFTEPKTPSTVIKDLYNKICELEGLITTQAGLITTLQGQVEELQQNPC